MNREIPLEIERKYVIMLPDLDVLRGKEGYTVSRITQTYLRSAPHVTHRVRRREYEGGTVYTETKKIRIDKISSFEDEREITEAEYTSLLDLKDGGATPVIKTRHTIPYDGLTVEIDVYPEWQRTCIMEIELPSRETRLNVPPFVTVVQEVTGDKRYSNAAMARSFPPELDV